MPVFVESNGKMNTRNMLINIKIAILKFCYLNLQVLPEDANVIDENPFTASGEMDLLATVLNDNIDVNSEEFQNFIALENEPDTEMSTINFEDIMGTPSTSGLGSPASGYSVEIKEEPMETTGVFISKPVKRGRGRPRVPRTAVVEPPR